MLKKKMEDALNKQVNEELYSAYLYLAMSVWFDTINLPGAKNWMYVQSLEEMTHAQKIFDFIMERGGTVKLAALAEPPNSWDSPLAAFEAAYAHEQHITSCIDNLVELATQENDNATRNMLIWFVDEQVEEEANADGIVQQLKMVKGEGGGLFMIDRDLKARVFTPPATGE